MEGSGPSSPVAGSWRCSVQISPKALPLLCLCACAAWGADPALLRHVMPEARALVGANLSQFFSSPIAQPLLARMRSSNPQLDSLAQAAGLDLERNLTEMLVAAPAGGKQNIGVVLLRGAFDAARLSTSAANAGARLQRYRGVSVISSGQETEAWFALLDGATAALGDPTSVRGVIDRLGSGDGAPPELLSLAGRYSREYDFWAVSIVPPSEMASASTAQQLGGILQGDILRSVVETGGGVKFGAGILLAGEAVARTEQDAAALADVARFFLGLAQLNAMKNPQAAAAEWFKNLDLRAKGRSVRLSLRISEADLNKMLNQAQGLLEKQPGNQPRTAPEAAPAPSRDVVIQSSPRDMGTVVIRDK